MSVDDTYTESQVIMTAVKIIAPFTLTYGLFMTFHGGDAPGGGFQGGTIVGVTVLMLAFAFGIEPTRQWLRNSFLVGLVTGGVVIFGAIGLAMVALGGEFLEFTMLEEVFHVKPKWGLEAVEIGGISLIVSGVIISLFFTMAAGFTPERPSGTGGVRETDTADESFDSTDVEVSDDD
ncbi:MnhB domain-containing protein [Natrinema longum]|uniref:Cation:proton antiporter n=1 Tax=Natrinema longum TaxID=370324 RepID=A0A8A2UC87_9EURY|nr:MnhB domain-containing protein [Natrinema longum]MBZ6495838.1 cation:proton antiporter [Natrinema longum]QSW86220.1 cation:proton antiporter [Natrinema longum]